MIYNKRRSKILITLYIFAYKLKEKLKDLEMICADTKCDDEKIVEVEITPSNVGHSPVFRRMFKRLKNTLEKMDIKVTIIGDVAYDARENFNMVSEDRYKSLFKVCKDENSLSRSSPPRRNAIIEQRMKNWSRKSGSTKR